VASRTNSKHKHLQARKGNQQLFENVPGKKRKHFSIDYNRNFSIVTKVNNILKLQSFLEHNQFGSEPTKTI
jgi:hypothetical protein